MCFSSTEQKFWTKIQIRNPLWHRTEIGRSCNSYFVRILTHCQFLSCVRWYNMPPYRWHMRRESSGTSHHYVSAEEGVTLSKLVIWRGVSYMVGQRFVYSKESWPLISTAIFLKAIWCLSSMSSSRITASCKTIYRFSKHNGRNPQIVMDFCNTQIFSRAVILR